MARKNFKKPRSGKEELIYIGRDLHELILLSGLKQREIAELLEVEPSALSRSLGKIESMKLGSYIRLLSVLGFQPLVFLVRQEQITDVFLRELQQVRRHSFIELHSMNIFLRQVLHLELSVHSL